MSDEQRGTGRTTRQIEQAPPNAIYVGPNQNFWTYGKDIAERLGRHDIQFVGPQWIARRQWRGGVRPIVVDHACPGWCLSGKEWTLVQAHNDRLTRHAAYVKMSPSS